MQAVTGSGGGQGVDVRLVKARAKVLAREDRELKAALIRIRQNSGMSQRQVADLLGVTQQAVNKLERYDSDPKMSTLRRYANAIGAIISHWATLDVGQSVHLAAASPWSDAPVAVRQVSLVSPPTEATLRTGSWSDAKRTDFALA